MPHDRAFTQKVTAERRARGRKPPVCADPKATTNERFDVKVVPATTGCWLWIGATYDQGYGMFRLTEGKTARAHRFSYERHVAAIPAGMTLDHLCEVKNCVNPQHLEVVTDAENRRRYHERRRRVAA